MKEIEDIKKEESGTVEVCDRCWKKNPAEVHTCTQYFHFEKYLLWPEEIEEVKNTKWAERIEYQTDTTKFIAYKLNWVLYITDMIQI